MGPMSNGGDSPRQILKCLSCEKPECTNCFNYTSGTSEKRGRGATPLPRNKNMNLPVRYFVENWNRNTPVRVIDKAMRVKTGTTSRILKNIGVLPEGGYHGPRPKITVELIRSSSEADRFCFLEV